MIAPNLLCCWSSPACIARVLSSIVKADTSRHGGQIKVTHVYTVPKYGPTQNSQVLLLFLQRRAPGVVRMMLSRSRGVAHLCESSFPFFPWRYFWLPGCPSLLCNTLVWITRLASRHSTGRRTIKRRFQNTGLGQRKWNTPELWSRQRQDTS